MSILMREYDYETDIRIKQRDAYEDGLERGLEQGISMGLEQGAYQTKLETAQSLLVYGDSPEKVALCTGLPIETIHELMQD